MVIKYLSESELNVSTRMSEKEIQWGRLTHPKTRFNSRVGALQVQRGRIVSLWKQGCTLTTNENLLAGESIWIKALDDNGKIALSLIGTVTWNEGRFRPDGNRCEVRFVTSDVTR